ncbi:hypothetical protein GIB67_002343 [Kingdonia uniflora]|uniref:Uncharacterized protein n=1 Tax=Kingdonia uniflora TaxID=39325 RepID=A0A7J7LRW1_9MAGN|nr:hypothetical protein GIB67_002343 [Kingdonia uniflora]
MSSEFNPVYVWDEGRRKLMIALNTIIQDDNLNSKVDQREKSSEKLPFSLYAIAEIPRLRLLQATLQQLEKEVSNISESYETVNKDNQSGLVVEIIKKCGKSVCLAWLEEELYLESRKHDKAFLSTTFRKLKDEDTILQNIKKSSKDDIYEDLLFYLRFGSIREGSCYDLKFLVQHGVDILEDLVITLSDGITGLYLELISVDNDMSSEISRLGLDLCSLSTRALQRLRNEVALDRWLHQNIESIVSMLFSEYIGLDTMMAIVCKTLKGVKALETYDKEGRINKSIGLHMLGPSIGRHMDGRYVVIWLEELRPYYVGDFVANDPQRRLALLKPRLPTGECPHGFLGFAVNMIDLESINLSCLTINGHGLRETLCYSFFSRVQVYKTRSFSRLSFQDEFDDFEFSCPFAVDDDDLTDPVAVALIFRCSIVAQGITVETSLKNCKASMKFTLVGESKMSTLARSQSPTQQILSKCIDY